MKPLTGKEKKERQRAILLAAGRVLAARGVESMTMEQVAREAGLAKGTLFLYYRRKDDLLLALFSGMAEAFGEKLSRLASSQLPPSELLGRLILALLEHFDRKRDITGFSAGLPLAGSRRETLRSRFAGNMGKIGRILARCAAGGLIELEDPLFAASALFGLCRGSTSYARAFGRGLPVKKRAALLKRIYLDGTRKRA